MKITNDMVKALQSCVDGFGSVAEFSRRTNISIETLSRYMTQRTRVIRRDTWDKLYPVLKPYLGERGASKKAKYHNSNNVELNSDERILLDAFSELTSKQQEVKLLEIVELARIEIKNRKS
jgi:hypothetical protein